MKVIYVSGDDYAAESFENYNMTVEEAYEKAVKNGGSFIIDEETDGDYTYCNIKAMEFGEVDKEFLSFFRNELQDYDDAKNHNFYIVGED